MNNIFAIFANGDPTAKLIELALERVKKAEGVRPDVEFFTPDLFSEAVAKIKTADALLFGDIQGAETAIGALAKKLNLHTSIRRDRGLTLVSNRLGGIFGEGDRHGFDRNSKFGRAAYDAEYFCELEIERTARVAYEFAEREGRGVLLLDGGSDLLTSIMWRKIVSDVNEDYPSVPVKMCETREFLRGERAADDVILCSKMFGDLVWAALRADGFEAVVGDDNVELYSKLRPENVGCALAYMLRRCFALEKGARDLTDALFCLSPHPNAEDVANALRQTPQA